MNLEPEIKKDVDPEVDLNEVENPNDENFKGKIVLIVDDDPFLLEMYARKFRSYDFEIVTAFNGQEAIDKINEDLKPDIILFDLIMPQMDGKELIKTIKELNLIPNAFKIVLSNQGQQADVSEIKAIGVDGYIIKAMYTPPEVVNEVLKIYREKK